MEVDTFYNIRKRMMQEKVMSPEMLLTSIKKEIHQNLDFLTESRDSLANTRKSYTELWVIHDVIAFSGCHGDSLMINMIGGAIDTESNDW